MLKKSLSEFAGTFLLVLCGTGAIVIDETSGGAISHPGIAAVFGLVVFIAILLFGKISGAHINPAVTITQFFRKKISATDSLAYLVSQIAGGISASLLLHFFFPANEKLGATIPSGSEMQSFILEFLLTFILLFAVLSVSESRFSLTAIAAVAGTIVGLEALFAGPICGASMNPARSIAPAIVSGHTEQLWIYILAPILGALTAAFANSIFIRKKI